MKRRMFLGKIHRAVVTDADLDYEGSVTIDERLLQAAGMLNHEEVHVWNLTRGTRFTRPGDLIIIAAFAEMDEEESRRHEPRIVRVDERNRLVAVSPEIPGPRTPLSFRHG